MTSAMLKLCHALRDSACLEVIDAVGLTVLWSNICESLEQDESQVNVATHAAN